VGEDISFDISLVERFNLNIFAFDPTPRVIDWIANQALPPHLIFHPYGLASSDGTRRFFPPSNPADVSHSIVPRSTAGAVDIEVRSLATILRTLGHSRIDLLKIDIEGAEYDVIDDMLARRILPGQLLIEFHHGPAYGSLTLTDKERAVAGLLSSGYRIAAISDVGMEYSFIHDSLA
jgi:FkbM family methyltransferase